MENRIITLKDITPAFGIADYVAFTLKEEFEKRNNQEDYDPIVMYVKKTEEQPDYWFDRAHIAATLAPMSLWDIEEKDRDLYMSWLEGTFSLRQLDSLFTDYMNALCFSEENQREPLTEEFTAKHKLPERVVTDETPFLDDYIELHLDPDDDYGVQWIASQFVEMADGDAVPAYCFCLGHKVTDFTCLMVRMVWDKGNLKFFDVMKEFPKHPFWFDDSRPLTIEELESRIKEMTEQKSLKRVYIDDIRLINLDGDNDTDKALEVIQRMRNLAKELKIKIYLISEDIDIWL